MTQISKKKIKKGFPLSILLVSLVIFLSGCATIEVNQVIDEDGTVSGFMEADIDLTDLYIQSKIPRESFSQADIEFQKAFCEGNITESEDFENVKCGIKNAKLTFSANMTGTLNESNGFFVSNGIIGNEYLFIPNISGFGSGDQEELITQIIEAREKGAKITFNLNMPGTVYEVEGGKISGLNAQFDMIEILEKGEPIHIRSSEVNPVFLAIVGILGFGIILLAPIIHWIIYRKREYSLYKDGHGVVGTITIMLSLYITMSLVFVPIILNFTSPELRNNILLPVFALLFVAMYLKYLFLYLANGFELTREDIFIRKNFMGRKIKSSQVTRVEIAKSDMFYLPGQMKVRTPDGEHIKPDEVLSNGHRSRKGILLYLKGGKTIFALVREINWVLAAFKKRKKVVKKE